jgi:hypothetical protein
LGYSDIRRGRRHLGAEFAQASCRGIETFLGSAADSDIGAKACESSRNSQIDPAAASGHEDGFSSEKIVRKNVSFNCLRSIHF